MKNPRVLSLSLLLIFLLMGLSWQPAMAQSTEVIANAVCDGQTDDAAAIQAAINGLPQTGGTVVIPYGINGLCVIKQTVDINNRYGVRIRGVSTGLIASRPVLIWLGSQGGTMMHFHNFSYSPIVENLAFDGNGLADHLLHLDVHSGESLHDPVLSHLSFQNYCNYALVLGEDDDQVSANGQMSLLTANHLRFQGYLGKQTSYATPFLPLNLHNAGVMQDCGGQGSVQTSAILMNAMNSEWNVFNGLWIATTYAHPHKHHIVQIAGDMQISGLVTSVATDYAIVSRGQIGIHGWHSEDRYMLTQEPVEGKGSVLMNVHQRNISGGEYQWQVNQYDDAVIYLKQAKGVTTLQSVRLQGSIRISSGDQRHINAQGVIFDLPGASYIFDGPQGQHGIFHDSDIGSWTLRGTSPSIDFRSETGDFATGTVTGLKGISATNDKSHNLRGFVVIKDEESFVDVVFSDMAGNPQPEPNNTYHVVATVNTAAGNMPTESKIIHLSHQQPTGFRLNIAKPPGSGNSVWIAWILIR